MVQNHQKGKTEANQLKGGRKKKGAPRFLQFNLMERGAIINISHSPRGEGEERRHLC